MLKYWPVIFRTIDDGIAASFGAPMKRDADGYMVIDHEAKDSNQPPADETSTAKATTAGENRASATSATSSDRIGQRRAA